MNQRKIHVYNTLSRTKEEFRPLKDGEVSMYACGVTPYKPSHLGHAMQAIIFDVIRRYFEYVGYKVTYVRNYTDVDDKIIKAAHELGVDALTHSQNMIELSDREFAELRIKIADFEPKVSENIEGIIEMTQLLIERGFAYATEEGNVYYRVGAFNGYGKLSNQKVDELRQGTRKDVEPDKEAVEDFALWKRAKEGEVSWTSPWGDGRPGWHIECSVMSKAHLGESFDIHGGGGDLIFPHHENEIAQSEGAHGKSFATYWMHNGLLMVGTEKMSKSLGNEMAIGAWLEKYHPDVIRYMILSNHYRSHVQFVPDRYREANMKVYQAYKTLRRADTMLVDVDALSPDPTQIEQFRESMSDDFNTVQVVAQVLEMVRSLNKALDDSDLYAAALYLATIREVGGVLGLFDLDPDTVIEGIEELELKANGLKRDELNEKVKQLDEYRAAKDYVKADELRAELMGQGIKVVSTSDGSKWEFEF